MELTRTLKGASLVIGLPILLHLLLGVSHARFGGWLAIVVTLLIGVCLSLVYQPLGAAGTAEETAELPEFAEVSA